MVDDCALGDLLLDPVSVRCGDERKAMKEGWRWEGGEREKQMEDRAVHREMTKRERGRKWNLRTGGKKKGDEKEKIMQGSVERYRKRWTERERLCF